MITAKLVGSIWATRKAEVLNGYKLMLVEVVGGKESGKRMGCGRRGRRRSRRQGTGNYRRFCA